MIYEWRNTETDAVISVHRTVEDRHIGPSKADGELGRDDDEKDWVRIISSSHPNFEHMRDSGQLERLRSN